LIQKRAAEDYFGIYVKLTRGYYEQFTALDKIPQAVGELGLIRFDGRLVEGMRMGCF
jgi:hypothetical protein